MNKKIAMNMLLELSTRSTDRVYCTFMYFGGTDSINFSFWDHKDQESLGLYMVRFTSDVWEEEMEAIFEMAREYEIEKDTRNS